MSPPRCASTAVARIFWNFPNVKYYAHEPFEVCYYNNADLSEAYEKILNPLQIDGIDTKEKSDVAIVIKEMPYQVGDYFKGLSQIVELPIIFLIRDPLLSIYSRIQKKIERNEPSIFPLVETGWTLLEEQVTYCSENDIQYRIIDTTDLRQFPEVFVKKLTKIFNIPFNKKMLSWKPEVNMSLDNLSGRHNNLYTRVLASSRIEKPTEAVPDIDDFPKNETFREHIWDCVEIFSRLSKNRNRMKN